MTTPARSAVAAVAALRDTLWQRGFRPVALMTGDKMPRIAQWSERARRNPPADAVDSPRSDHLNTGLLLDGLRALDVDVDDGAVAMQVRALAVEMLGETIVRTRANSPRAALLYRAATGEPGKRVVAGTLGKIEILGRGQQLHAFGTHPSGVDVTWTPDPPGDVARDDLPVVTEAQIDDFLAAVAPLVGAKAGPDPARDHLRRDGGGLEVDHLRVLAALHAIPNDGPPDWERWNNVGMATWAATGGSTAGLEAWAAWSARNAVHDDAATRARWAHFSTSPPGATGPNWLFRLAREERPGEQAATDAWPRLDTSIATRDPLPAPDLPLADVFPPAWAEWIARAAEAKGAPPGYVATALLAIAGGLIANARWAEPWADWAEPPVVNVALVGAPSAGKSPALDVLMQALVAIEADDNTDLQQRRREHATAKLAAETRRAAWEKDAKAAVAMKTPPPTMPADADEPDAPQRRRIVSTDPTVAKAERMSAANPRGLILVRDELSGWIAGMERYSGGGDRQFWLQANGGRPWMPDRVKDGDAEIAVANLTWSIVGGIQPDRLASAMLQGDDDGMAARFLYCWPEAVAPRRPPPGRSLGDVRVWLGRLHHLPWAPAAPVLVPFTEAARVVIQEWREQAAVMEAAASGLFLSWVGKLPGFAARLAVIFAHLAWCATGRGDPPADVTEADVLRAVVFLQDYAVPMARRAFGEAALPQAERDSRRLARWLLRQSPRPAVLNARDLRRIADGPGLPDAARVEAALQELAALGWVREAAPNRAGRGGRSRADWVVHPDLTGGSRELA
jgi:hypothetical protein